MKQKNIDLSAPVKNLDKIIGVKIGVVTACWNENITFLMRDACIATLVEYGVDEADITSIVVPGAFELPMGAKMLMSNHHLDGIVCIGCVIKGDTKHDEYISNATAHGIMNLGLMVGLPIIFGVLTPNTMQQAIERSGGKHGNKGVEAALTLVQMLHLKQQLKLHRNEKGIGF